MDNEIKTGPATLQELLDVAIKEADLNMNHISYPFQDRIRTIMRELAEGSYVMGRKDEQYYSRGPITQLYAKRELE